MTTAVLDLYVHSFRQFATQVVTWIVFRGCPTQAAVLAVCADETEALGRARAIAGYDRQQGRASSIFVQHEGRPDWEPVI